MNSKHFDKFCCAAGFNIVDVCFSFIAFGAMSKDVLSLSIFYNS